MKTMKLYGFKSCPHCQPARDFLTSHKIPFDYYDVKADADAMAEFKRLRDTLTDMNFDGKVGVPAFVFGDKILIGLDEEKVLSAYEEFNK